MYVFVGLNFVFWYLETSKKHVFYSRVILKATAKGQQKKS